MDEQSDPAAAAEDVAGEGVEDVTPKGSEAPDDDARPDDDTGGHHFVASDRAVKHDVRALG